MRKLMYRLEGFALLIGIAAILCSLSACNGSPTPAPPGRVERPDLTFTGRYNFEFQRTLAPTGNDLYHVMVEVRNQGAASVNRVQVTAHSKGPGLEGDRPPVGNDGYYSLAPGETIQARFEFIFEKQFFGEYEFSFTVDPSNAVQEEDESNNRLVIQRTF